MAHYHLTHKAEQDIDGIYAYSIREFGLLTADDYLHGLFNCFERLASHPTLGSDYGYVRPYLLRYEYRSHAVYYTADEDNIVIATILGGRQDPMRHIHA